MEVTVDMSEITDWINNSASRERAKMTALKHIGIKGEEEIRKEAQKISTSGKQEASIRHEAKENEVSIFGTEYSKIALEYGRRAGKAPPIRELKRWALKKFGDEKIAYAVQKTIAKRGTRKSQRGGPKQITNAIGRIDRFIDKELVKLLDEYAK